ncbi:hypothetical protein G8T67_12925, partial [Clostridium botulinum C/D]|nr:hypothetical protein [Clostridium botulinum C/D]
INTEFLMKYVYNNFINELKSLNNFKEVLLIPLGKAVEGVLLKLGEENIINKSQILMGFPHPSGANVNRKVQFQDNRENMIAQVRKFFMEKP